MSSMHKRVSEGQVGMVSIMVTMIMLIVISLIVLGFATVTRHNERETLDRQLSTEAYYAAESGVNEAYKAYETGKITAQNTGCTDLFDVASNPSAPLPNMDKLSPDGTVAYTCLLVNPYPNSLVQAPMASGADVVWPLVDHAGNNLTSLTFTWTNDSSLGNSGACGATVNNYNTYPVRAGAAGCHFAVLRVDLLQASNNNLFEGAGAPADEATALANETISLFMQPSNANTAISLAVSDFTSAATRKEATGRCVPTSLTGSGTCTMTVTLPGNTSSYYARISTIYNGTDSLTVTGHDGAGSVSFQGGQAVIDSTGKAQDELRRIQVRTPLTVGSSQGNVPNFAIQSNGSICKQLTVGGGVYDTGSCTGY